MGHELSQYQKVMSPQTWNSEKIGKINGPFEKSIGNSEKMIGPNFFNIDFREVLNSDLDSLP